MASPTITDAPGSHGGVKLITWPALANGAAGDPVSLPEYGEGTFQVSGTFGTGGSITIEGSNDGVTWTALYSIGGVALTTNVAAMMTSGDRPLYVRPRVTAGDGTTSLTVVALKHRQTLSSIV